MSDELEKISAELDAAGDRAVALKTMREICESEGADDELRLQAASALLYASNDGGLTFADEAIDDLAERIAERIAKRLKPEQRPVLETLA